MVVGHDGTPELKARMTAVWIKSHLRNDKPRTHIIPPESPRQMTPEGIPLQPFSL